MDTAPSSPTVSDIRPVVDADAERASFTTFEESTAADWSVIASQLPVTQAIASANILEQLRMLERDHGGFPVSRLEHSLQTATMA
ncbi:MAG: hypothetical protein VW708_06150, partial [Ilumatobacter sp.]